MANNQAAPAFLKRDRFMAGLFPPLRDKVELKFPHTFEDALRIAQEKERKLKFQAQRDRNEREIIRGEGMHEGQTALVPQNLPPMGNTQEETLFRLTVYWKT